MLKRTFANLLFAHGLVANAPSRLSLRTTFGRAAKNKDSEIRQKKIQKMSHKIGGDTGHNEQVTSLFSRTFSSGSYRK